MRNSNTLLQFARRQHCKG